MIYTVHVGRRSVEWPPEVSRHPTRGEAQIAAQTALREAPGGGEGCKAQVRCEFRLFDGYGRHVTQKGAQGEIRHVYEYKQRAVQKTLPVGA